MRRATAQSAERAYEKSNRDDAYQGDQNCEAGHCRVDLPTTERCDVQAVEHQLATQHDHGTGGHHGPGEDGRRNA